MEFSFDALMPFFKDGGSIHCSSIEERLRFFEELKAIGFELGFDESIFRDQPWEYVYMYYGKIHFGDIQRGDELFEYSELYHSEDDGEDSEDFDLPDITELIPCLRVKS